MISMFRVAVDLLVAKVAMQVQVDLAEQVAVAVAPRYYF
jgi:hypothetical protein